MISDKSKVATIHCNNYEESTLDSALENSFNLLGGLKTFISPGDTVLLKPNFVSPRPRETGALTDPAFILAVARLLKDHGAKPFIGDSPAWGNVFDCIKKLELDEPLKKLGVPVKQLDQPRKCIVQPSGLSVGISTVALDADKIINLPKFKTHRQMTATFAIKNMFGCVAGKEKPVWHFKKGHCDIEFSTLLISIYHTLAPILNIIDGIVAMEGNGPVNGDARELGWIVTGQNPIACEYTCSKLINFDPKNIPILRTGLEHHGWNTPEDHIEFIGDDFYPYICTDFQAAELMPIRFSLPRICKSAIKQFFIQRKKARQKSA